MSEGETKKLTFGIMPGPLPPWEKIVGWAKLVESLGFDRLWLPDHFVNPDDRYLEDLLRWVAQVAVPKIRGEVSENKILI